MTKTAEEYAVCENCIHFIPEPEHTEMYDGYCDNPDSPDYKKPILWANDNTCGEFKGDDDDLYFEEEIQYD